MSEGLMMKYFVLKPKGTNVHAQASRKAMRVYANYMMAHGEERFGQELRDWADKEWSAAIDAGMLEDRDGEKAL